MYWHRIRSWLERGFGCASRHNKNPIVVSRQRLHLCALPTDIVSQCFTYLNIREHQRLAHSCRILQHVSCRSSSGTHFTFRRGRDGGWTESPWPPQYHTFSTPRSVTLHCVFNTVQSDLVCIFLWFRRVDHLILHVENDTLETETLAWHSINSHVGRLSLHIPAAVSSYPSIWPSHLVHLSITLHDDHIDTRFPSTLLSLCVEVRLSPKEYHSWLGWWNDLSHLKSLSKLSLTWATPDWRWGHLEWNILASFPSLTDLTLRDLQLPSSSYLSYLAHATPVKHSLLHETEPEGKESKMFSPPPPLPPPPPPSSFASPSFFDTVPSCKRVTRLHLDDTFGALGAFFGRGEAWRVCGTLFPMVEDVIILCTYIHQAPARRALLRRWIGSLVLMWPSLCGLSTSVPIRLPSHNRIRTLGLVSVTSRRTQRMLRPLTRVSHVTRLTYYYPHIQDTLTPLTDMSILSRLVSFTWQVYYPPSLKEFFVMAPHFVSLTHLRLAAVARPSTRVELMRSSPYYGKYSEPSSTSPPYRANRLVRLEVEDLTVVSPKWFVYLMNWCHDTVEYVVTTHLWSIPDVTWRRLWLGDDSSFPRMSRWETHGCNVTYELVSAVRRRGWTVEWTTSSPS